MVFLAAVAAKVLEWIMTIGGRALYEWATDFIARKQEEKRRAVEKVRLVDDLKNAETEEDRRRANENILN